MATLLRAEKSFFNSHLPTAENDLELVQTYSVREQTYPSMAHAPTDERVSAIKLRKLMKKSDQSGNKKRDEPALKSPKKVEDGAQTGRSFRLQRSRSVVMDNAFLSKSLNAAEFRHKKLKKLWKMGSTHTLAGDVTSQGVLSERGLAKKPSFNSMPAKINLVNTDSSRTTEEDRSKVVTRLPPIDASQKIVSKSRSASRVGEEEEEESNIEEEMETAEKEVNADWLLEEKLREQERMFERRKNALLIVREEDPVENIEKRVGEIKFMTRARRDKRPVIERFSPELRERVLRAKHHCVDEIRKRLHGKEKFKWVADKVRLILRCFWYTKLYHAGGNDRDELRKRISKDLASATSQLNKLSSVGAAMEAALRLPPEERDEETMKEIIRLLKMHKSFSSLFPNEMEYDLARNVGYERYDDGRIIGRQSQPPERFYYVLGGQVSRIREFEMIYGTVRQHVADLSKGQTTDVDEMENQWLREDVLVAKGPLEVLILEKEAFNQILTTHKGPPVDFLKSIDLFEEFDKQVFQEHPDAIQYKYHAQGKVVLKDANRSSWIHIIKSGSVKVVRRQAVLNSKQCNQQYLSSNHADSLMAGRYPSHAKAMVGFHGVQKKLQDIKQRYYEDDSLSINPFIQTLDLDLTDAGHQRVLSATASELTLPESPMVYRGKDFRSQTEMQSSQYPVTPGTGIKKSRAKLPSINVSCLSEAESVTSSEYDPHDLWLTRERTTVDRDILDTLMRKKTHRPRPVRETYLQLDVLKARDVFGLDCLHPPLASDPPGLALISEGAEIVKVSKRFFLQFATNNTRMKVELMYKNYMNEEEAQDALYERETWVQYREALWRRLTSPIKIPTT